MTFLILHILRFLQAAFENRCHCEARQGHGNLLLFLSKMQASATDRTGRLPRRRLWRLLAMTVFAVLCMIVEA